MKNYFKIIAFLFFSVVFAQKKPTQTVYFEFDKFDLNKNQKSGITALVIIVFIQFALGVFTLLYSVPLWLGLTHQVVAFFLLTAMTYTLHRLSK